MLVGWPKRRNLLLYLAATVLVTAVTFFMLITSEPYEFAKSFVTQDSRVLQVTGAQTANRFSPLKGFRYVFGDRTGEANFTFKVTGDLGSFDVRVVLEKREGQWAVIRAQTVSSNGAVSDLTSADRS
jgi:hypothetical protein